MEITNLAIGIKSWMKSSGPTHDEAYNVREFIRVLAGVSGRLLEKRKGPRSRRPAECRNGETLSLARVLPRSFFFALHSMIPVSCNGDGRLS